MCLGKLLSPLGNRHSPAHISSSRSEEEENLTNEECLAALRACSWGSSRESSCMNGGEL